MLVCLNFSFLVIQRLHGIRGILVSLSLGLLIAFTEVFLRLVQSLNGFIRCLFTTNFCLNPGSFCIHTPLLGQYPGGFGIHTPLLGQYPGGFGIHAPLLSQYPGGFGGFMVLVNLFRPLDGCHDYGCSVLLVFVRKPDHIL